MSSEEDPWSGIPEEVKAGSEAPVPQVSSVHKMEELQEKIRETQQTYGRKVHKRRCINYAKWMFFILLHWHM